MKLIGIIDSYNGKYGLIKVNNELINFESKDISFNQEINKNDKVEFRLEIKFPDIKIARNINKISYNFIYFDNT